MAYDSGRGVTVLFGGLAGPAYALSGETWEWNGSAWTQRLVIGPSPRYGHAMAYDAVHNVTVLFGGNTSGQPNSPHFNGETWQWDGSAWTQRTGSGPSERAGHAMAYHAADGGIVLFGGRNYYYTSGRDDTWRLSVSCYPNCDASSTPSVLNILDFICFLNRFAAGDPYANCDGSTTPPVLNIADFSCFLNQFAAGCP
jgi:hypothetical protein